MTRGVREKPREEEVSVWWVKEWARARLFEKRCSVHPASSRYKLGDNVEYLSKYKLLSFDEVSDGSMDVIASIKIKVCVVR